MVFQLSHSILTMPTSPAWAGRGPWQSFGLENTVVQCFGIRPESHHTTQVLVQDWAKKAASHQLALALDRYFFLRLAPLCVFWCPMRCELWVKAFPHLSQA